MFNDQTSQSSGGGQGAGARENRGREGYGRRERKGREARVLRGRAAREKYETLIFLIQQCVRILSKTRSQNKNRLTSGEIVHPITVVTSKVSTGHEMSSGMKCTCVT